MRLAIITINYNGSKSTIRLLNSLNGQTDPSTGLRASKDFQVIVVDNASEEADFNNLKTAFNRQDLLKAVLPVNLIKNDKNLGFSGGNNVGIKKALEMGAEWLVLLNNDTWVETDFVSGLRAKLRGLEGVVGMPLAEGDHTAYCGKIEWLKPTLKHIYENPKSEIRNPKQSQKIQNSKSKTVSNLNNSDLDIVSNFDIRYSNFYIVGGGMLIHKDVFEKIGFLDEKYFLYFEDVDYSVRARKNNIPIDVLEKPLVHHTPSSTTKKLGRPLLMRYHYRNALYFNFKNGPWYIKLLVWPWSWIIVLKQMLKIMIYHNCEESSAILKGVFDFYLNRMGKIK